MVTAIEQIACLAKQLTAMQTDVPELQNAFRGSATRSADLMVQLIAQQSFLCTEAPDYQPQAPSGEKGSESFTAFKVELQSGVGSLHDYMIEEKEGRLMELDIRNAGTSQETVDDFKEMDRRLYQVLFSSTKGESKNYVCDPER